MFGSAGTIPVPERPKKQQHSRGRHGTLRLANCGGGEWVESIRAVTGALTP